MGGLGVDLPESMTIDNNNNIYLQGEYSSAVAGTFNIYNQDNSMNSAISLPNASQGFDCFLVKYNAAGTAQWATRLSSPNNDSSGPILLDSSSNIYMTGYIASNPFKIYNQDNSTNWVSALPGQSGDVFLVKYNTGGFLQWATRLGGSVVDTYVDNGILLDSNRNIYMTGYYASSPLNIYNQDNSTNVVSSLPNSGSNDTFLVKYNMDGFLQWATHIGGTANDLPVGLQLDSSSNIYLSGSYTSNSLQIYNQDNSTNWVKTLPSDTSGNTFLVKYDTTGAMKWATHLGGTKTDTPITMELDSSSNIYIGGSYASTPLYIYNQNSSTKWVRTLSSEGGNDAYIVKYNSAGTSQWATHVGGTGATDTIGQFAIG